MKPGRGPLLGLWLALCFHGPLVAAGLYRYGWDATTHMFFADHYRRSWFGLWEPRWFGGFSVSSYPPLVHQLLALLSVPFGYDGAFAVLLLSTLVVFPIAVWRFAQLFVPPAAASGAAVVAVFLPGMALAAYLYGQLPTLVAITLTLFLVFECTRFVERGGGFGPSPNPPDRAGISGADAADPGVVSCARSVTHQRMRAFTCSSPPSARLAPHPNLRRPIGGSGLRGRVKWPPFPYWSRPGPSGAGSQQPGSPGWPQQPPIRKARTRLRAIRRNLRGSGIDWKRLAMKADVDHGMG